MSKVSKELRPFAMEDVELFGPVSDAQGGPVGFLNKLRDNLFDNSKFTALILMSIVRPGTSRERLYVWKLLVGRLWPQGRHETTYYGLFVKETIQSIVEELGERRRTPLHRTHDDDGMPVERDEFGYDILE